MIASKPWFSKYACGGFYLAFLICYFSINTDAVAAILISKESMHQCFNKHGMDNDNLKKCFIKSGIEKSNVTEQEITPITNTSNAAQEYKCDPGQYLPANATKCTTCKDRYYVCAGGSFAFASKVQGIIKCPAGQIANADKTKCEQKRNSDNTSEPKRNKECEPGKYLMGPGLCWSCPDGYACPGGKDKIKCVDGKVSNSDKTKCITTIHCVDNMYLPANSDTCHYCKEEYICKGGDFEKSDKDQGLSVCEKTDDVATYMGVCKNENSVGPITLKNMGVKKVKECLDKHGHPYIDTCFTKDIDKEKCKYMGFIWTEYPNGVATCDCKLSNYPAMYHWSSVGFSKVLMDSGWGWDDYNERGRFLYASGNSEAWSFWNLFKNGDYADSDQKFLKIMKDTNSKCVADSASYWNGAPETKYNNCPDGVRDYMGKCASVEDDKAACEKIGGHFSNRDNGVTICDCMTDDISIVFTSNASCRYEIYSKGILESRFETESFDMCLQFVLKDSPIFNGTIKKLNCK